MDRESRSINPCRFSELSESIYTNRKIHVHSVLWIVHNVFLFVQKSILYSHCIVFRGDRKRKNIHTITLSHYPKRETVSREEEWATSRTVLEHEREIISWSKSPLSILFALEQFWRNFCSQNSLKFLSFRNLPRILISRILLSLSLPLSASLSFFHSLTSYFPDQKKRDFLESRIEWRTNIVLLTESCHVFILSLSLWEKEPLTDQLCVSNPRSVCLPLMNSLPTECESKFEKKIFYY